MKSEWIDVSIPVKDGMVNWPGDPPVRIRRVKQIQKGDPADVSHLSLGSHTGTHMDAPGHFIGGARTIDRMPLEAVIGPARVIEVKDLRSVQPEHIRQNRVRAGERILFRTRNSTLGWKTDDFFKDYVFISLQAARELAKLKVLCVGIDYLSVGGFREDSVEIHQALLSAGIWIIEGLNLSRAKPGNYDLICLPLRLQKGDGAPARAVLRKRR